MTLSIVAGSANPALAESVAAQLGLGLVPSEVVRFPDGELRPVVGALCGDDVYVVQPTSPPVNEHLVELLLMLDACQRAGAHRVTAVVPYFGYARQDRPSRPGESVGVQVAADAIAAAGADRLVVVDPHAPGFEAVCPVPVEVLLAAPVLARLLARLAPDAQVVVAPDHGALGLAAHCAALLKLPVVVVRKHRLTGADVRAEELVGDVDGRHAVIVDDMISTGATIAAAAGLLAAHGAAPHPVVGVVHGLFVDAAASRLADLELGHLVVSDTVVALHAPSVEVCPVAPLLAAAIERLQHDERLDAAGASTGASRGTR